jgi:Arc/MetJ-type ribon-helix-helix transcriptional regulator
MPLSVRLDRESESVVTRIARKQAKTKSEVVREAIKLLSQHEKGAKRALKPYDAMKHSIGCADSGGMRLSEKTGEKFYRVLVERRRERRSR